MHDIVIEYVPWKGDRSCEEGTDESVMITCRVLVNGERIRYHECRIDFDWRDFPNITFWGIHEDDLARFNDPAKWIMGTTDWKLILPMKTLTAKAVEAFEFVDEDEALWDRKVHPWPPVIMPPRGD